MWAIVPPHLLRVRKTWLAVSYTVATVLSVPVLHLTHVDRAILGCRYGCARPHADIPLLVELYRSGRLDLDGLVSRTAPLEEFESVASEVRRGALARGVLTF